MKILFVCSGNICRSPMAAEYMRDRAARDGLAHVVVDSAGTLGIEGAPASDGAVRVLAELGLDLAAHRSKGLTEADVRSSDLVVAMAADHLEHLAATHPGGEVRRLLLRSFEAGPRPTYDALDLDDPIGCPDDVYRECFERIRRCVDHLVIHLRNTDGGALDG